MEPPDSFDRRPWRRILCFFGIHAWMETLRWDDGFAHAICRHCEIVECCVPVHQSCPICDLGEQW